MKKLYLDLICILVLAGTISSCIEEPQKVEPIDKILKLIEESIVDPNETIILNSLYNLGSALKMVNHDKELINVVHTEVLNRNPDSEEKFVTLQAIINSNYRFADMFEDYFISGSVNSEIVRSNSTKGVLESMSYKGEKYNPEIYIPNYSTADLSLPPVILIGTELVIESEEFVGDVAGGWDPDGTEVLYDERKAMASKNPVWVISVGKSEDEMIVELYQSEKEDGSNFKQNGVEISAVIQAYGIKYRYENDNYSELSLVFQRYQSSSGQHGINNFASIHQNDVNKLYWSYIDTQSNNPLIPDPAGLWVVSYERDWLNTKKDVTVSGGPYTVALGCNMKYSNEYYEVYYIAHGSSIWTYVKGNLWINYNL